MKGETTAGIPQGASTSSLLFLIMINDLPGAIKNSLTIIFADDTQIIISGHINAITVIITHLQNDLENINEWMNTNQLKLNIDKTKYIVICKPNQSNCLAALNVTVNSTNIERVKTMKILGVTIDERMSWTNHTRKVVSKCSHVLSMLFPLRDLLSVQMKKVLVNAYLMSILNYCSIVWMVPSPQNYKRLDKIVKKSARFIFRKRYICNVDEDINCKLQWLLPKYRYQFEMLKFAFKIVNNQAPQYFYDYVLTDLFSQRHTRQQSYNVPIESSSRNLTNQYNITKAWID